MNLTLIVQAIINQLQDNLAMQSKAAKDAHNAATHSESVAENKYDTFGLESSYLAQGQQKRVQEISVALHYFQDWLENNTQAAPSERQFIEPLCAIELQQNDQICHFCLAKHAGGLKVIVQGKPITVITPASPIGKTLSDKMVGDCVDIGIKGREKSFEVLNLY